MLIIGGGVVYVGGRFNLFFTNVFFSVLSFWILLEMFGIEWEEKITK